MDQFDERTVLTVGVAVVVGAGAALWLANKTKPAMGALLHSRGRKTAFATTLGVLLPALLVVGFRIARFDAIGSNPVLWLWTLGVAVQFWAFATNRAVDDSTAEKAENLETELKTRDAELAQMTSKTNFALALGTGFRKAVGAKRDRLKALPADASAYDVLATLSRDQFYSLLMSVHALIEQRLRERSGGVNAKLRVVYFAPQDGHLKPVAAWNGESTRCCLSFDGRHPDVQRFFALDNRRGCLAVKVAMGGTDIVLPNCEEAAKTTQHGFTYFEDAEKVSLRSIAAMPITMDGCSGPPYDVLVADTDLVGFFDESELWWLRMVVENLAQRLHFEKDIAERLQQLAPPASSSREVQK